MGEFVFTEADRRQLETLGIAEAQVRIQIDIFRRSSFFVRLNRPCIPGDGVHQIHAAEVDKYLRLHRKAAQRGRFIKFVPASGAATRLFQTLFKIYHQADTYHHEEMCRMAENGDSTVVDFLRFMDRIRGFAFIDDLREVMAPDGLSLDEVLLERRYRTVLEYLLTDRGLNYGALPKALLKFHCYPTECRTAFEEHLVEAAHYAYGGAGACRLYFTISPEHEEEFRRLLEKVRHSYGERFGVTYEVYFSFQKSSTDTIAVDENNDPFRDKEGRLVFRPGGHGALLENLNALDGDLVYIKNVDNLIPDRLKETTSLWKRVLGGYLVEAQEVVHGYVRNLKGDSWQAVLDEAVRFARLELLVHIPGAFEEWPAQRKRSFLLEKLNRPIRVCGVVPNVGEPGGAPFWVEDEKGELSLQIVEKAQVDFDSPEQRKTWGASTHFNPVDLVCALRDHEGKSFDLRRHVDPNAVFITRKSKDGRELKALELPGLWNGAMADWITIIVEVPGETFNPVKTICDLLRPEHQPERLPA